MPTKAIKLKDIGTGVPKNIKKDDIKKEMKELIQKMRDYQQIMYAQGKYNILIVLQGMDGSGKDNAIKKIFSGLNPLGCDAISFTKPTEEEYKHDFLWRIHKHAPARGMVQIFNRSYYEDVLVPTVEKLYPMSLIKKRYEDINNFESLLEENDTIILKFFLHISPQKQEEKFKERLVLEHKFWKFDPSDIKARSNRFAYEKVYEEIFAKCNHTPRHIIPADENRYKNYLITKVIIEAFEKEMKLSRPDLKKEEEEYRRFFEDKDSKKIVLHGQKK